MAGVQVIMMKNPEKFPLLGLHFVGYFVWVSLPTAKCHSDQPQKPGLQHPLAIHSHFHQWPGVFLHVSQRNVSIQP